VYCRDCEVSEDAEELSPFPVTHFLEMQVLAHPQLLGD